MDELATLRAAVPTFLACIERVVVDRPSDSGLLSLSLNYNITKYSRRNIVCPLMT